MKKFKQKIKEWLIKKLNLEYEDYYSQLKEFEAVNEELRRRIVEQSFTINRLRLKLSNVSRDLREAEEYIYRTARNKRVN